MCSISRELLNPENCCYHWYFNAQSLLFMVIFSGYLQKLKLLYFLQKNDFP